MLSIESSQLEATRGLDTPIIMHATEPLFPGSSSAHRSLPHHRNFSKWLVKNGVPVKRYGPHEAPSKFEKDIVDLLE
jgi:glutathione peroxidase-family protein